MSQMSIEHFSWGRMGVAIFFFFLLFVYLMAEAMSIDGSLFFFQVFILTMDLFNYPSYPTRLLTLLVLSDLTAVNNLNSGGGGATGGTDSLNGQQDALTLLDLSKDSVLAIQPRGIDEVDEELASVGVLKSSVIF